MNNNYYYSQLIDEVNFFTTRNVLYNLLVLDLETIPLDQGWRHRWSRGPAN